MYITYKHIHIYTCVYIYSYRYRYIHTHVFRQEITGPKGQFEKGVFGDSRALLHPLALFSLGLII